MAHSRFPDRPADAYGNAARELAPAFESTRDACFFVYFDLQVGFLNAAARRDVAAGGMDPASYVGARLWDLLGYDVDVPARQVVEWVIKHRLPASFCMRSAVTEKSWVENEVIPLPSGVLIWYRDAGAVKQTPVPAVAAVAAPVPAPAPAEVPAVHAERGEIINSRNAYHAVQRLAGGIAHDINNLVTAIKGSASELQEVELSHEQVAECAREIELAADRAASLTGQLLAFSRRLVLRPSVFDVGAHLRTIEPALAIALEGVGILKLDIDAELGNVYADPQQIERALLNLVVNARDAIRGRPNSRVVIRGCNVELSDEFESWHVEGTPGPFIRIDIEDNGPGIEQNMREHLFEPFFTTKALGLGPGLGLATSYGIVKQSGGYIWVRSAEKTGTVFSVYLPRSMRAAALATPAVSMPAARNGKSATVPAEPVGNERILLVEDEDAIRRVARRSLESHGYRITEASDGAAALQLAEQQDFDLLLTDVEMPKMRGTTLVARLKDSRPRLPVLFMSGHSDQLLADGTIDSTTPFLAKPFTPPQLAEKVKETLAKHRARARAN